MCKGQILQLSNHEFDDNSRKNSGRHKTKKHCECIQEEVAVTRSHHGASYSKSHYSEIISFMTEFTFWEISEVSFSSIKYWLFSRILYSALSRVANLVSCKPRASKKKYLEKVCLAVKKTQRKTELSNEDRVQTISESWTAALPLTFSLLVNTLLPLTYLPTYLIMYLFIHVFIYFYKLI